MPKIGKSAANYWIARGWDEFEAEERRVKPIVGKNRSPMCVEFWLNKGLSEEEAKFKINSQRKTNIEFWLNKGFTIEESNAKIKEHQKKSNSLLVEKLQNNEKFSKLVKTKQSNSILYWLNNGYSEDEAKVKLTERQTTFSLKKCVEKYGELEGKKIWNERQKKWLKSLNNNDNLKMGYSSISQELFRNLDGEFVFYASKNSELPLNNSEYGFLYDFSDILSKKIIEFNGDIYHANPLFYKENDTPNPFNKMTSKELWEKDRKKIELAEKNGFQVLTIWESEYKKDKEATLKKCLEFLNN